MRQSRDFAPGIHEKSSTIEHLSAGQKCFRGIHPEPVKKEGMETKGKRGNRRAGGN